MALSAITNPGFKPTGLVATNDLSTKATHQYRALKGDTSNAGQVVRAGAGEAGIGVLQNAPIAGEATEIISSGQSPVKLGGTLTAYQEFTPDANGDFVLATTGDVIWGYVVEGGAAGEHVSAFLNIPTRNLAL